MLIRPASPNDAHRIASIHVEAWMEAYRAIVPTDVLQRQSVAHREAFWFAHLQSQSCHTLVMDDGGDVLGWIDFGDCRDADAHGHAEVYAIYLDPQQTRRGIGSALWRAMYDQVKRGGRRHVVVWVLAENYPARRFYQALGGKLDEAAQKTERFGDVELVEVRYCFDRDPPVTGNLECGN